MPTFARDYLRRQVFLIFRLRNRHFFVLDLLAFSITPLVALTLRLDRLDWWPGFLPALALYTLVSVVVKVTVFYHLDIYRRFWRHAGLEELTLLLIGVGCSTAVLTLLFVITHSFLLPQELAMYRTVPVIDGLLTVIVAGGYRFGVRGLYLWYRQQRGSVGGRRVLVVGAGDGGRLVVDEMRANPQLDMEPVGFVDDDSAKAGMQIQGLSVLGTCDQISELVHRHEIQRIIIAMPSAPFGRLQKIMTTCQKTGVATYNLPGMYELLAGHKTVSRLPEVDINRLLRRQPVEIDETRVAVRLAGARVLVTGAGGSIGRELCRQIARLDPAEIILLGHGENSIFEIGLELRISFADLVTRLVIADVRAQAQIEQVVEEYRPDIIFHTAAHKHVPLMEDNVVEAITNNVLGTRSILRAAEKHDVQNLVLISTDKAVNPINTMGATKRLAELLVLASAHRSGHAYMVVRFGNVLGSRGSVIPVFQRQIAAGGPVTVTHPEMCRYFMTIPEAVQLVLQASTLGHGAEIFVLDMGQPVRIVDLAEDLIRLSGLEPGKDIKITYTGIRPGEKLNEQLFLPQEFNEPTSCPRIHVAKNGSAAECALLEQMVIELINLSRRVEAQDAGEEMRILLPRVCEFVDNYVPFPARAALPAAVKKTRRSTGKLTAKPSPAGS